MWRSKNKNLKAGFTIVELLIVIVVIGILAAISIVAYNGIQTRSQDAKRASDYSNIEKALLAYNAVNGGVPTTSAFGGAGGGGWNNSTMTNWLTFLESGYGKMPRDSVNSISGAEGFPDEAGERAYFYFCYGQGSGPQPATANVTIGYRSARTDTVVNKSLVVTSCLNSVP